MEIQQSFFQYLIENENMDISNKIMLLKLKLQ